MSCGRNRRRPKLASTGHSRVHNQLANTQSTSRSRKSNHPGNLSKQILRENIVDFDRFRILDDKGNDVTPRPIIDYVRINIQNHRENEKSKTEIANNQEPSVSDKSIIGTTNLTTSTSRMAHTRTLFSAGEKAAFDIGTRIIFESEQLLSKTQNDRTSRAVSENQEFHAKFLPGLGSQVIDSPTDNVFLSETETMFILDLTSDVVSKNDNDEYDKIDGKNKVYMQLSQNRQGNDLYIERGMQTFNDLSKHEQIATDPILIRSQSSWVNIWDMYDSAIEANQYEGKIYRQYIINKKEDLNENQYNNIERQEMSDNSSKLSSTQNSSAIISKDSLVKMTPSKTNCFEFNDTNKNKLPEIDVDGFIMERILNLNAYQLKQIVYRGFNTITDNYATSTSPDDDKNYVKRKDLSLIKNTNLSLERLWHYASYLTDDRNVSCLCLNERHYDLLAVGYGKFQYNDDKEGLVCCWNAKNPEFPERYYYTEAGVTSLSFSLKRPNFLAVGLFNGNICVFDLNENNTSPIVNTNEYEQRHTGPVWQLEWYERDRSSEMDNTEVLISISSDGRITQWILRKEFEASDYMRLKPYNTSQMSCQALKTSDGTTINRLFSSFVGGLCFDIQPDDRTIYLCGTDEGFIHQCSTIYNEKYLESYIGHTGPVYKVHWSPFAENIFLSASTDWTARIWMSGYSQSAMIFSSSNSKVFFDAIWSPKSSTMFCCVSEKTIEIWDLSKSIFDPICIAHCANHLTLTSIAYATNSDCILIGTSDGAVWIYHLEYLSSSAGANDLIAIVQQNLRSQIDSHEKSTIDREVSLTSTQY